jgi:hypothetical protein
MLEKLIKYLADLLVQSPRARAVVARYRLSRIKAKHFLKTHPTVAFLVLLAALGLYVINEYLPEALRSEPKCRVIETENKELYQPDGNVLRFGEERPCEHQQPVGLEFFEFHPVRFQEDKPPIDLVSPHIFLKETARNVAAPNQWHEYSVYAQVNNFLWNDATGTSAPQLRFVKGSCDILDSVRTDWENRQGLLLRSYELRSNPKLKFATWLKCNYGTPEQPEFKVCDYLNLEFFIPTISPARLCPDKVGLWDRLFASGSKKIILTDATSYEALSALARVSWDETKATPVPTERWQSLSKSLP